jgi:hypothetical protein
VPALQRARDRMVNPGCGTSGQDLRPGGASENSPALSAPGKVEHRVRPGGTPEVLMHTLRRVCENDIERKRLSNHHQNSSRVAAVYESPARKCRVKWNKCESPVGDDTRSHAHNSAFGRLRTKSICQSLEGLSAPRNAQFTSLPSPPQLSGIPTRS